MNINSWRSTDSQSVLGLVKKNASFFGITRLADITQLDIIGIPVYICIRPRGQSVSVSAGKGITEIDAMVSALMESVEMDVAERLKPHNAITSTYNNLPLINRIPYNLLPIISGSSFNSQTPISWVEGIVLGTNLTNYIPFDLVSMNTRAFTGGLVSFAWGSNGLASSVERQEAILSGLYEVVERDSVACWSHYYQNNLRIKTFCVSIPSIPFSSSQNLISKIVETGLELYLIQLRNELNIPVFKCHILNNIDQARPTASGYGCHHSAEIAINRAITEAVQGRACFISGSREDILTKRFNTTDYGYHKNHFAELIQEDFACYSHKVSSTGAALISLINSFDALGWHKPVIFDYPNSGPFSVVKVICPSLTPVSFSDMSVFHTRLSTFAPPRSDFQLFCESLG